MSKLATKTYGRKPECRSSVQFDHLLAEKGNKPSTAKVSVAGVHRWGMTSFTSIRKNRINGQKEPNVDTVKRVKLEPNPPPIPCTEDPFSFETDIEISAAKSNHSSNTVNSGFTSEAKPAAAKPNKFFKSSGSRLLSGASRPPKNSDFDALRLSVASNFNVQNNKNTHDFFLNMQTNFKTDIPHVSEDHNPVYLTNSPNIVDLRYCSTIPSACASNKYTSNPSVHYLSPFIQPISLTADSSSQAFDALRTLDLSARTSDTEHNFQSDNGILKNCDLRPESSESVFICKDNVVSTISETNLVHQPEHPVSFVHDVLPEKDSCEIEFSSSAYSESDAYPSDSKSQTDSDAFPQSQESGIGSQSPEKIEEFSKQSARPKKIFSSSLKFKAVYNHRHWHSSKKEIDENSAQQGPSLADEFEDEIEEKFEAVVEDVAEASSSGDIRSIKCPKPSKEFYTVIKNVKQAYQCHESGETQEFNDDIEYLLECVQECNAIGTRCLSVLNLAAKCMGPAFRIHLRAHGTMPKIFSALSDAPSDPNLALCTATLMFVLSQDRLTMDIEASTLSLMIQLLETDQELENPEKEMDLILKDPALCAMQEKHREKVYQLCEEMKQKGHAKHLKLDNINTGILAMETLLSLTSRKAGEWFKEEMRTLHGLDRIADAVTSSVSLLMSEEKEIVALPNDVQLDKLRKIDRCLRVLENVTHMNSENQEYIMNYKDSSLLLSCIRLLKLCKSHFLQQKPIDTDNTSEELSSQKPAKSESPVLMCLLNLLKILSNITYKIPLDDERLSSEGGLMDHVLMSILQVPRAVPLDKRFDLLVLCLGLMINLVEYCGANSKKFIEMYALGSFDTVNDGYEMIAAEALVEVMLSRLEAARVSEEQADELLSSQEEKHAAAIEKKDVETAADDLEETLMKTLQKAGKHMEHSIIAAYIAILLGCVSQSYPEFIEILREYVPDGKFDVMVEVLKKFKSFVTLTGSVGSRELVSIQKVIQVLESS
ncbi:wings apart-like protein homolog [Uloborus diversus]|uniref:wings apart-like protein homolog n=1 Tax=Uloborus diversus TaxID=327109 RepID=UPI002409CA8D|nr:wings apart-like protein homolog [Uloborus diversus]